MKYCKVKTTGQVIETQSGDGDLEMFYDNNSAYSRDELEVGIADDEVVEGWLAEQIESNKTYLEKRKEEYPSIEDVTVALAEKAEGDSTMWDEITVKRQAVKEKYPKE